MSLLFHFLDQFMENSTGSWQVRYPQLSLTGYRELAAHLQQLPGITVRLLPPQTAAFDYGASQVGALEITGASSAVGDRLRQILTHYGPWERLAV